MIVSDYFAKSPDEQRRAVEVVRNVILDRVPKGYEEKIRFSMIGYGVPLSRYRGTCNGAPLNYAPRIANEFYGCLLHGQPRRRQIRPSLRRRILEDRQ